LAAAIKNEFGITANLKEGHDGIFAVTVDGRVVYTNSKECGRFPKDEQILQRIGDCKEIGVGQIEYLPSKGDCT